MKKDRTENIQKTYKKCAPYGNCTEIVQKIYKKCAKFCNSSLVETGLLFELLQILAHFLYVFCMIFFYRGSKGCQDNLPFSAAKFFCFTLPLQCIAIHANLIHSLKFMS